MEPLDGFRKFDRITRINEIKVNKGKKILELQGRHTTFSVERDALPQELLKNNSASTHPDDHGKFFYSDANGKFYQCQVRDLKDALKENHLFVAVKIYKINHIWIIDLTYAELQFALYRLVVAMRKANELHMSMLVEESEADHESQVTQTGSSTDIIKMNSNNNHQNSRPALKQSARKQVSHVEHGPAPVESQSRKAIRALYYIIPILVIIVLIVAQQFVSKLKSDGIAYIDPSDTVLFPKWRKTHSTFRFYIFDHNITSQGPIWVKEHGPFIFDEVAEKNNFTLLTPNEISFDMFRSMIYKGAGLQVNDHFSENLVTTFQERLVEKYLKILNIFQLNRLELSSKNTTILKSDFSFIVKTGKNRLEFFNHVIKYNKLVIDRRRITLGDAWPNCKHSLNPIDMFLPEFCASLLFDRIDTVANSSQENFNESEASIYLIANCFYKERENMCTKEISFLSDCQQLKDQELVVTFPHFHEANKKYLNAVKGLDLDNNHHLSYFLLSQKNNNPIKKVLRLQINLKMPRGTEHILLPLFWFEQEQNFL